MIGMRNIFVLCLIFTLVFAGCVKEEAEKPEVTTELDSDILNIEKEMQDLDISELDQLDQDLAELEKLI